MSLKIMSLEALALTIIMLSANADAHQITQNDLSLSSAEKQWLKQHPEISIAFDGHFPPYSFINDDDQLEGLSVELFEQMGRDLGIKFKILSKLDWKALYEDAQHNRVDVVATMVDRPERNKWFAFSSPYIFKSLVVIVRDSDDLIQKRNDIAGKTVALVKGYQYADQILTEYPTVKPLFVDNMLDAMNAVSVGEADATITFLGAGHFYRNKYLLTNLKYAVIFDENQSNESIAVRKDWPQLVAIINKYLANISEHRLQQLRQRWLPVDYMEDLVEIVLTDEEKLWIEQHPQIRLGVDPEFAPFEYVDSGQYKGMASDYVKILNRRLNLNMQIVDGLSWKEVTSEAQQKRIDVMPAVAETEQRKQYLLFTPAYLNFHRVIITREDSQFISGINDLDQLSVAVQINSSHHGFIEENSTINPLLYKTLQESLMAVSGGEADAFIGNVASATFWGSSPNGVGRLS